MHKTVPMLTTNNYFMTAAAVCVCDPPCVSEGGERAPVGY